MDTYAETITACVARTDEWKRQLECLREARDAEEFMRADIEAQGYDPECDIDVHADMSDGLVRYMVTCEGTAVGASSGGCNCGVVGGAGRGSLDLFAPIEKFLRSLFS